jgi:hypothetical protein
MTHQEQADQFWKSRGNDTAKAYWESRDAQYRALIADSLRPLAPFVRILEVGCMSGPNLWAIRQQFPDVELVGMDPSPHAVSYGAAMCHLEKIPGVEFWQGAAPDGVGDVAEAAGRPDIVLSVYAFAYLQGSLLDATLRACCDVAAKAVVLAEPMCVREERAGLLDTPPGRCPSWRHDYRAWFAEHHPGWQVTVRPFPRIQELNGLLIARRP